tara:strand:- start:555 stop:830 length:276 start_codon:yes stop_codon:yes gene_type:complete
MEYQQIDNDGAVFEVPQEKRPEEWMAPWSGKAMVNGKMFWVSIYDNVSKSGNPWRKLKFKEIKDAQATSKPSPAKNSAPAIDDNFNDDLPF